MESAARLVSNGIELSESILKPWNLSNILDFKIIRGVRVIARNGWGRRTFSNISWAGKVMTQHLIRATWNCLTMSQNYLYNDLIASICSTTR
jgi:hypothetical protein